MNSLHTPVDREIILIDAEGQEELASQLVTTNLPEEGDDLRFGEEVFTVTSVLLVVGTSSKHDVVKVYCQSKSAYLASLEEVYKRISSGFTAPASYDAAPGPLSTADEHTQKQTTAGVPSSITKGAAAAEKFDPAGPPVQEIDGFIVTDECRAPAPDEAKPSGAENSAPETPESTPPVEESATPETNDATAHGIGVQ